MALFNREPRFKPGVQYELQGGTLRQSTHKENDFVGPGYNNTDIKKGWNIKTFSKREPMTPTRAATVYGRLEFKRMLRNETVVEPTSYLEYDAGPGFYTRQITNHYSQTIHCVGKPEKPRKAGFKEDYYNPMLKQSFNKNAPATTPSRRRALMNQLNLSPHGPRTQSKIMHTNGEPGQLYDGSFAQNASDGAHLEYTAMVGGDEGLQPWQLAVSTGAISKKPAPPNGAFLDQRPNRQISPSAATPVPRWQRAPASGPADTKQPFFEASALLGPDSATPLAGTAHRPSGSPQATTPLACHSTSQEGGGHELRAMMRQDADIQATNAAEVAHPLAGAAPPPPGHCRQASGSTVGYSTAAELYLGPAASHRTLAAAAAALGGGGGGARGARARGEEAAAALAQAFPPKPVPPPPRRTPLAAAAAGAAARPSEAPTEVPAAAHGGGGGEGRRGSDAGSEATASTAWAWGAEEEGAAAAAAAALARADSHSVGGGSTKSGQWISLPHSETPRVFSDAEDEDPADNRSVSSEASDFVQIAKALQKKAQGATELSKNNKATGIEVSREDVLRHLSAH